MKEAQEYLKHGVDLRVINLKTITYEDLEQLVLDTYNDAYHAKKLVKEPVSDCKTYVVPEYVIKVIKNALRLTANIYGCRKKYTAYDREVMRATEYTDKVLAGTIEL